MTIEHIFGGADLRCEELRKIIKNIVYERGNGIPVPSIIGVLEIIKLEIYEEQS